MVVMTIRLSVDKPSNFILFKSIFTYFYHKFRFIHVNLRKYHQAINSQLKSLFFKQVAQPNFWFDSHYIIKIYNFSNRNNQKRLRTNLEDLQNFFMISKLILCFIYFAYQIFKIWKIENSTAVFHFFSKLVIIFYLMSFLQYFNIFTVIIIFVKIQMDDFNEKSTQETEKEINDIQM